MNDVWLCDVRWLGLRDTGIPACGGLACVTQVFLPVVAWLA